MQLKHIITVSVLIISLVVCGCVGAGALIPSLNNEAPGTATNTTADPAIASDPVVGTWKLVSPVMTDGDKTVDLTDASWTFGADGSYEYWPLNVGILTTTGTWTKAGEGHYQVVCGKDSQIKYYNLTGDRLCSEEDPRFVLEKSD